MFDADCKHAPEDKYAKHCKKQNEGNHEHKAGKGNFGCARHCKFREAK